jgi:hypothetical protein
MISCFPETLMEHQACIDACNACADACVTCGGEMDDADNNTAAVLCDDCADVCEISVKFMRRGTPQMFMTCDLCARLCDLCAQSCEQHNTDAAKQCAQACRRCAEACREMARVTSRTPAGEAL